MIIRLHCFVSLILIFLIACSTAKEEEKVETDVNALEKFINLDSLSPMSVKWIHGSPTGKPGRLEIGPTDYYVIAVISLSEEDFTRLKAQYETKEKIQRDVHFAKNFVRPWFSETVKECFEEEGNYLRINVPVYDAATFIKTYIHGMCFFTKNNEILIKVST